MLKKTILFGLLLSATSFSFAKNLDSTLIVAPDNPDDWGYMGATVTINNNPPQEVGSVTTLPVSLHDHIALSVYAMNAKPALSDSCQHIEIQEEGHHELLFKLENDWLVDCHYS